jgi:hypothetical protein
VHSRACTELPAERRKVALEPRGAPNRFTMSNSRPSDRFRQAELRLAGVWRVHLGGVWWRGDRSLSELRGWGECVVRSWRC